jgi:hypothetical protein
MVQTITYKGVKYPYRVGYRALKKVSIDLGREFEYDPNSLDHEALEALLYYAMEGEYIKAQLDEGVKREDIVFPVSKEQMEFVLDDCLIDLISSIQAFSQAAEQAASQKTAGRLPMRPEKKKKH